MKIIIKCECVIVFPIFLALYYPAFRIYLERERKKDIQGVGGENLRSRWAEMQEREVA